MSDISRLESFMNMMKSKGQSIETFGTSRPEVGLTAHCRISSTDNVRQGETGTRPARFHGNHAWSTKSKAFLRSTNAMSDKLPISILFSKSSVNLSNTLSHDRFSIKPDCSSSCNLYVR